MEAVKGREGEVRQRAPPKCSLCQSLLYIMLVRA